MVQNIPGFFPEEGGQRGPQAIKLGQFPGTADAENHRGALPVEGPVAVAGIFQGPFGDFQREQLQRLNGSQGIGRHTVSRGVKGNVLQESAPSGADFVPGVAVLVIIEPPIPARGRHFLDGVDLTENIFPERGQAGSLGHKAGQAHDGNIRGLGRCGRRMSL